MNIIIFFTLLTLSYAHEFVPTPEPPPLDDNHTQSIDVVVPTTKPPLIDKNDYISLDEYYNLQLDELPNHYKKLLNTSCNYRGKNLPVFSKFGNPVSIPCPAIRYYYFKNYTIEWQRTSDMRHVSKHNIKENKLWIPKLSRRKSYRAYICTVHTDDKCLQSLVTIDTKFTNQRCYEMSQELYTYGNIGKLKYYSPRGYYKTEWYKNEQLIHYGSGKYSIDKDVLIINNLTLDDSGRYICKKYYKNTRQGKNDIEASHCIDYTVYPRQDHNFDITVTDYPILKVKIGEPANTTCTVVGKSKWEVPFVSWHYGFNGSYVEFAYDVVSWSVSPNTMMLYFVNVSQSDIGTTYECIGKTTGVKKTLTITVVLNDNDTDYNKDIKLLNNTSI
ncbi:interferon-alpha/beta-receptor-like secreted glycoprotein [Cotia virus SPAn232]|uniref:Soluble interferon alpha/beta receptor OPG204 n=2 Tax=Cotia virus TaxID=39444 RepID=H6TAH3_9POXV|nr:interferon-alpha/beta-receptor-like secreted glycoprotein [Cotia virus SPAn232]AFB76910.1 interferon-alpha/beta-receptor-like secreted glycoprotein [Cotia virus SPAn232]AIT70635.1 interferon-alpha/beta-receptor-like secreted glycoprotein [Cotia virus]